MARFTILLVASLLAFPGLQAFAQEKDQAKPKAPQQAPLPFDVADWSTTQLLGHYDPAESDNKVGRELERRGKDKRFIVFNKGRTVDAKSSEFLLKELKKGFPERQWYEVSGTLAKTYKVGVQPEELFDENPLYPGEALRLDETCLKTNRKWEGTPLLARQVLYLAITDTKELQISKVGDAHDILDKLKGKNAADSESWLKERYPEAYRTYGEKKERNQLPILKISSDKLKTGAAPNDSRLKTGAAPNDTQPIVIPTVKNELSRLRGTWVRLSIATDGSKTETPTSVHVVLGDRDMNYKYHNPKKQDQTWKFTIDPATNPKTFDRRRGTSVVLGIYKLEGDRLIYAFSSSNSGKRPADFAANRGSVTVQVYRRQ
jgi:uncharacterized protein (TIGR03067 family)